MLPLWYRAHWLQTVLVKWQWVFSRCSLLIFSPCWALDTN